MASNPCAETSAMAEATAIELGRELHLPAPDGSCKRWLIVGDREKNTAVGRQGWRAVELGDEPTTPEGEEPFTGRVSMIYDDVLNQFHIPA